MEVSNGFLSDDNVIRNRTENGSCSSNGAFALPKWKPRKVSAVRDFPPGCGPIVQPVNTGTQEAVATSTMVNNNEIDSNGLNSVEISTIQVDVSKDSKSKEDGDLGVFVEPQKVEMEVLMNTELQNGDNQGVVKDEAIGSHLKQEVVPKKRFPQRRVSAVRDFPPYCGLDAPEPTEEERKVINGKRRFGAEDKGGGRNVKVEGSDANAQSDELSNEPPVGNQAGGVSVTTLSLEDVGDERSMKNLIVGGDESNAGFQDGEVKKMKNDVIGFEPRKKFSKKQKGVNLGQACRELVVYSHEKALKVSHSNNAIGEDSEGEFEDEGVQNSESQNRSLTPIQKDSKNFKKHLKKGPLEGCIRKERKLVLGTMAPPLCPLESVKEDLSLTDDCTNRSKVKKQASVTPKKSKKRNVESTGKVPYTGTLDVVVRNEDFVTNTEEQRGDSSTAQRPHNMDVTLPPFGPKSSSDARNKVRETLRLFQAVCRKLLQGEEAKTNEVDESKSVLPGNRIDLAAIKILKEKGKELNTGLKILGSVPGVEVGDEFQYRVELALVGVHRLYQAGIDYFKQGKDLVAASIVASGGYNDELDNPDCLMYSGSGGIGKDKQHENQKLERGNLALKNNIFHKHPVRVIRGSKVKAAESSDSKSKTVVTYVYDGLYLVDRYRQEPGPHGNLVFKFELRRIPGQPELPLREVKKSRKFKIREGLCVDDITNGNELFRICAVNTIDDEKPPSFNYITKMIYPDWYHPVPPKGCDCVGRCSDKRCPCAFKNGGEIPYNRNGAIVEAKQLVYECGPSCKCPPTCYNRVTQNGIKIQLEIFKTESRGWGVRSLNSISSGSFICEYIGELLEDTEAEKRTGNDEYLFDIGQNYNDCSLSPESKSTSSKVMEDGGFTIDAAYYGNVGRFINHSCSPNLYAQNVLYDQEDKRMPHIMFFAAENISPLQELTYHYNYAVDTVHDSDGNIKIKTCYCGSSECTGRMY